MNQWKARKWGVDLMKPELNGKSNDERNGREIIKKKRQQITRRKRKRIDRIGGRAR